MALTLGVRLSGGNVTRPIHSKSKPKHTILGLKFQVLDRRSSEVLEDLLSGLEGQPLVLQLHRDQQQLPVEGGK